MSDGMSTGDLSDYHYKCRPLLKRIAELEAEVARLQVIEVNVARVTSDWSVRCQELEEENEQLQAQVEQYKEIAQWDWVQDQERRMKELRADLDKAEAEVERLRKRYEYVRDYCLDGAMMLHKATPEEKDAAIDAAIDNEEIIHAPKETI